MRRVISVLALALFLLTVEAIAAYAEPIGGCCAALAR